MTYRVSWDTEGDCFRIDQEIPAAGTNRNYKARLEWLRFASEEAAHAYVELYGLPPRWRKVRVRSYVRATPA